VLNDVVVDTNVLMHADDPRQSHQEDAQALLKGLNLGLVSLCVDEGFNVDEAQNKSLIGGEYFERLSHTHTAMAVLAHLFSTGGIVFVSRAVPRATRNAIQQCVRNKRDRTFLCVAHNSADQVLCSEDLIDMQRRKRQSLRRSTGVEILGVADVRALI
jgi:hypothetical protein